MSGKFCNIFIYVWAVNDMDVAYEPMTAVIEMYESWINGVVYIVWSAFDSLPHELLLIEATTTHYMRRLLVLILLLKLRFDILMWLIFFQKEVRSILNIAAVFTCDRWECKNPNLCPILCVESFWKWYAYIAIWIKRRGSWILCMVF